MQEFLLITLLIIILAVNVFLLLGFFGFFTGAVRGAPFVPSGKKDVKRMINFANIKKGQNVYDLGSGDGRIIFAAAKKGANATGIEISRIVHIFAILRKKLFREKGELLRGSLWDADLKDADIIFTYLLPPVMKRFEKEMLPTLKKGCIIVSHGFSLPNTKPIEELPKKGYKCKE